MKASTCNDKFELPDRSYYVFDFEIVVGISFKKLETLILQ